MSDAVPREPDPEPSSSSQSRPQRAASKKKVAPARRNDEDSSDEDCPGVTIDDDDSSYTMSPQKAAPSTSNESVVASSSVPSYAAPASDRDAFVLPQSLMPTEPVSAREAEYLIQNAHMAYAAAEKASNCRIHAEASGSNCEAMMRDIQGLRTYVTKLQNQQRAIRLENTQALKEKMDIESKYDELKVQYTAILEQGLNAKSAADEARKWRDDYEKSQAVLVEFIDTYSALREKYNESVKLASAFAEERDIARNDCYDEYIKRKRVKTDMRVHVGNISDTISILTDFIDKNGIELPEEISAKVKEAKLDAVAGLAIANRRSPSPLPPPTVPVHLRRSRNASTRNPADESDSEIGDDLAIERALAGLGSDKRTPSPMSDVAPAPAPKRRVAHRPPSASVVPPKAGIPSRRMSDDEVSIASSTGSRRSARIAKKQPAKAAPPARGRGRGGRGRGRGGRSKDDDGPDSRPDMPPPPLPVTRSRGRGRGRGSASAGRSSNTLPASENAIAAVLSKELMTSDDDYSISSPPKVPSPMPSPTKSIASSSDAFDDMPSSSVATRSRGRGRGNALALPPSTSRRSSTMTTPATSPVKSLNLPTAQDLMDELMTSDDNSSATSSPMKAPSSKASPTKPMPVAEDDSFDGYPAMDNFEPPEPVASTPAASGSRPVSTLEADLEMSDSEDESASDGHDKTVSSTASGPSKAIDIVAQDLQLSESDDDDSLAASPSKSLNTSKEKDADFVKDGQNAEAEAVRAAVPDKSVYNVPSVTETAVPNASPPNTADSTAVSNDTTESDSSPKTTTLPSNEPSPAKEANVPERWMPTSPPPKTVPSAPVPTVSSSAEIPTSSTSTSTISTPANQSESPVRPTSLPVAKSPAKVSAVPDKWMPTSPPPKTASVPQPTAPVIPPKSTAVRTVPPSAPRAVRPSQPASKQPQKATEKPVQQAESSDDFFMDILSAAKTAPPKPTAPIPKKRVEKPAVDSMDSDDASTADLAAPSKSTPARAKVARTSSSPLKPRTLSPPRSRNTPSTRKAAANRAPMVQVPVTAAPLSEDSSDEEDVPPTSAPSTSKEVPMPEPVEAATAPAMPKPSVRSILPNGRAPRGGRSGGVRATAVAALPPTSVPTSKAVTTEGSSAPSIHGRKTLSVREQQKLMSTRKAETMEMLKAEKEKLNLSKPLPKKPTISRAPPKKSSVTVPTASADAEKGVNENESGLPSSSEVSKIAESTEKSASPAVSEDPGPSTSAASMAPPVRPGRVAHVPAPGSGLRASANGKSMDQIKKLMARQSKQRLAGIAPKPAAAPKARAAPAVPAEGARVLKKRGRKTNAERAAIAAAAAAKEAAERGEALPDDAETPEPPPAPTTRKRAKPDDSRKSDTTSTPKTKKQKTAEEEPASARQLRSRGQSSTASPDAPQMQARRIFSKILVASADTLVAEFVETSIQKVSADELSAIALECALKIDQKDLFPVFEAPEYDGDAILSEQEERFLQLINEFSQYVPDFTRKLFMALAKQLASTDRMPAMLVNRNYRLVFVLMQFIEGEDAGLSNQEKSMVDRLLDNLVLQRAPTAVASTLCYLILIADDTIKRYLTKRVIEDSLGYGELLTLIVNECPAYTETLSTLITEKTEIDYASSRLSQPLTSEDYLFALHARLGEAYFTSNGLTEFEMDGELILTISPAVQRISNIVSALFSPEVMADFDRKAFLRAGFQLIQKLIRHWTAPSPVFNDAFYDDLTQAARCPDDFDPTDETSVANAVQLIYTFARILSIPFRRLSKSNVPVLLRNVVMELLTEFRRLSKDVSAGLPDGAVKQKLTFGITDAVEHLTESTK
uniref:Chromatin modification-related protein eaf-1-like n=1 Tax=Panagrellus redivivus TaxID=6233 RepID=A0A7E4VQM7_PANRE